jgi:hypothetical protein
MAADEQPTPLELICACEQCGRRYAYDFRKGHTKRKCNSCRNRKRSDRRALKQRMVDYKGGCCEICGYDRCLRALDFHHIDPGTKRFTLAHGHNRRWEDVRRELEKCALVCSNCHLEFDTGAARTTRRRTSDPTGDSKCEGCGKRFQYKRPGTTRTRCASCCASRSSPEARRELKRRLIDYKGGACELCGYRDHWAALTFHHLDPRLKRFNIAGSHGRKLETLREETDRCILVCANCHDELEDGARSVPLDIAARIRTLTDHLPRQERRPPGRPRAS